MLTVRDIKSVASLCEKMCVANIFLKFIHSERVTKIRAI